MTAAMPRMTCISSARVSEMLSPTELEMAQEIRTFIANLTCPTHIVASHDSDIVKFEGLVPKDQKNMLKLMDVRMENWNEKAARRLRDLMHRASFYD